MHTSAWSVFCSQADICPKCEPSLGLNADFDSLAFADTFPHPIFSPPLPSTHLPSNLSFFPSATGLVFSSTPFVFCPFRLVLACVRPLPLPPLRSLSLPPLAAVLRMQIARHKLADRKRRRRHLTHKIPSLWPAPRQMG